MKAKLVLMSHGHFAEELKKSAEMIVGELEDVYTVAMLENDGLEGTQKKLEAVLDQIGDCEAVVAVDMFAGTPCNIAVQALYQHSNICVVAGLNLPMALEYMSLDCETAAELAANLRDIGLEAVMQVEKPTLDSDEDGYED